MVSRATVYRYFPSVDALIREGYFGRAMPPLEEIVAPGSGPVDAIGRATEVMNRLVLEDEAGLHIVKRAFMQIWPTDVTYIRLARGFAYLVAIIDWYSRKVLSWRISNSMDASFCVDCLEDALRAHGKPEVFNSDQGVQFTSNAFTGVLKREGKEAVAALSVRWLRT